MTFLGSMKDNVKNIPGWRTQEKLVVLAVDDYGSVRLDSKHARDSLVEQGIRLNGRFDRLDAFETREDLEALLETLRSVTDDAGRHAVVTAYALCANPSFEKLSRFPGDYHYETMSQTLGRLSADQPRAYDGAWQMWSDGIQHGLLKPQFHGREHLNVELIERKLRRRDRALRLNVENRSLVALGEESSMPGVRFTHAFGFWERDDIARHRSIIADGLELFKAIFGFRSKTFTPPAQRLHPDLFDFVESQNVEAIDKPLMCKRRLDRETAVSELNWLGHRPGQHHITIVRNVVFEPGAERNTDSVSAALSQIATAFRWRKPAIISSHRVNFSGHLEPLNRRHGLEKLALLLSGVVRRWPDVQFIGADELVDRMHRIA